jgi:hypothetical protein
MLLELLRKVPVAAMERYIQCLLQDIVIAKFECPSQSEDQGTRRSCSCPPNGNVGRREPHPMQIWRLLPEASPGGEVPRGRSRTRFIAKEHQVNREGRRLSSCPPVVAPERYSFRVLLLHSTPEEVLEGSSQFVFKIVEHDRNTETEVRSLSFLRKGRLRRIYRHVFSNPTQGLSPQCSSMISPNVLPLKFRAKGIQ